ncbi:MAG: PD40 domain-containing protein [Phycisphaerales bacterium]|nr:MAG: PD40 domain-containing protein [Phycisphaerales bacterium]
MNRSWWAGSLLNLSCFILVLNWAHVYSETDQTSPVIKSAREERPGKKEQPKLRGPYLGRPAPGSEPQVFAPGIVTSANINHSSPAFSPDGKEIFWSRVLMDPPHVRIFHTRLVDSEWTQPRLAPFSSKADDDCPAFSPDGKRLFFVSHRPNPTGGADGKENIWYVERRESGWSAAKPISSSVNKMNLHWQVSVSSNYTLYFACSQAGVTRIYRSRFIDGEYAEPSLLPAPINSGSGEETPYIAPDEDYIVFSSQRAAGCGGADLYISFKDETGDWLEPMNLGCTVNSASYELLPHVSPDQKYLFFVSARGGEYDIYWVDARFIKSLRRRSGLPCPK